MKKVYALDDPFESWNGTPPPIPRMPAKEPIAAPSQQTASGAAPRLRSALPDGISAQELAGDRPKTAKKSVETIVVEPVGTIWGAVVGDEPLIVPSVGGGPLLGGGGDQGPLWARVPGSHLADVPNPPKGFNPDDVVRRGLSDALRTCEKTTNCVAVAPAHFEEEGGRVEHYLDKRKISSAKRHYRLAFGGKVVRAIHNPAAEVWLRMPGKGSASKDWEALLPAGGFSHGLSAEDMHCSQTNCQYSCHPASKNGSTDLLTKVSGGPAWVRHQRAARKLGGGTLLTWSEAKTLVRRNPIVGYLPPQEHAVQWIAVLRDPGRGDGDPIRGNGDSRFLRCWEIV